MGSKNNVKPTLNEMKTKSKLMNASQFKRREKINKQVAIETKIEVIDNSNLAKKAKQLKPE